MYDFFLLWIHQIYSKAIITGKEIWSKKGAGLLALRNSVSILCQLCVYTWSLEMVQCYRLKFVHIFFLRFSTCVQRVEFNKNKNKINVCQRTRMLYVFPEDTDVFYYPNSRWQDSRNDSYLATKGQHTAQGLLIQPLQCTRNRTSTRDLPSKTKALTEFLEI